jgi:CRISPR/Cas system-associated exonuclease Cas4 (RecB family)
LYNTFYNSTNSILYNSTNLTQQTLNENLDDNNNYEYLFNRTYQKVRQIIKTKPEIAKTFYILLNKTLQEEIANEIQKVPKVLNNGQIKNPSTIKSKGNFILKF